jgi:hypothetical protein
VLVSVTTDAGAVELEHVGLWSYWEQVGGWLARWQWKTLTGLTRMDCDM